MNMAILAETPVGQLVARLPQLAPVLEELQIDYCCGGNRSLAQACQDRGLSCDDVLRQLEHRWSTTPLESDDGLNCSATELCDHIETTHHVFLREQLPRLSRLIDKVVQAHGETVASLHELQSVFGQLRRELEPHMLKEEQILFPAIRRMEAANSAVSFPFGSVRNPMNCMEHEHDAAGRALRQIRRLTNDFTPPDGACTTYRVMLEGLHALERDMHEHVHKENNILFPRAVQLEQASR